MLDGLEAIFHTDTDHLFNDFLHAEKAPLEYELSAKESHHILTKIIPWLEELALKHPKTSIVMLVGIVISLLKMMQGNRRGQ